MKQVPEKKGSKEGLRGRKGMFQTKEKKIAFKFK